jgi:TetR/AcrR family transcriptional repressor of nem operon
MSGIMRIGSRPLNPPRPIREHAMNRAEQKQRTHRRIVDVAMHQLGEQGLSGVALQRIMKEAGLTHGGFYSHFDSKADLVAEALAAALRGASERLFGRVDHLTAPERRERLLDAYLSRAHRDAPGAGCPLASTSADVARSSTCVRRAYEDELRGIIEHIEADFHERADDAAHVRAVGTLALCVGGLLLARAVDDPDLSDDILQSCRHFGAGTEEARSRTHEKGGRE